MGFIEDQHGRITVEGKSDGFVVHASYGYRPMRRPVGSLRPDDEFRLDGKVYEIDAMFSARSEEGPSVRARSSSGDEEKIELGQDDPVEILDEEEFADHPLGDSWRERSHPVFMDEDLDDLIAALEAHRERIRSE